MFISVTFYCFQKLMCAFDWFCEELEFGAETMRQYIQRTFPWSDLCIDCGEDIL